MGNLVGILSTVILVSTVATLIFAVFAYVASRKRQQKSTTAPKHSGNFVIPDGQRAPDLPQEFILRMHEVHDNTIGKKTPLAQPPQKKTAVKPDAVLQAPPPETTPVVPAPANAPVFRSLADKKKAADTANATPNESTAE